MNRFRMGAIVAGAAIAIAGCGGGDDSGASKDEFAKKASNICSDTKSKIEKLARPNDFEGLEKYAGDLDQIVADANKQLGDLEVPSGDDGDKAKEFQSAFAADYENQIKPKLDKLKEAAASKDKAAVEEAANQAQIETPRTDRLAKEVGANACAE